MRVLRRTLTGAALLALAAGLAACATPPSATTLVALGLQAQLAGDLTTAESNYQQAIKLDANNMVAHYDLGTVYDGHGETALAVGEYTKALIIDPSFTDALFNLAVDTSASDPSGAEQSYLKVVSLQPTFAAAWLNMGFLLQAQGNITEARADWAKAVALDASLASRIPAASTPPAATPNP